jgi:hypothetical protein
MTSAGLIAPVHCHCGARPYNYGYYGYTDSTNKEAKLKSLIGLYSQMRRACNVASFYYSVWWGLMLFLVTVLTLSISIIAYIISSRRYDEDTNQVLNIVIGSIGFTIVALNTIQNGFKLQVKKDAFAQSYVEYRDIVSALEIHRYDTIDINCIVEELKKRIQLINDNNKFQLPWFLSSYRQKPDPL